MTAVSKIKETVPIVMYQNVAHLYLKCKYVDKSGS